MPTRRRCLRARIVTASHLPIACYLVWVGLDAALRPDQRIVTEALPWWLANSWAVVLMFGGALIITGVLTNSTRAESAGHGFHLAGLGIYAAVAVVAGLFGSGVVAVILALGGVSVLRLIDLSDTREAQEAAAQILNDGSL